jgi:hypothetical protein
MLSVPLIPSISNEQLERTVALGEQHLEAAPTGAGPDNSSVSSSRSKAIAKNISLYTHAVVENATRTVHRDTVKARVERQSLEKDRWQKHYHDFVIMAEEQFRWLRKFQVSLERLEAAIRKLEEIKEKAIDGMTSCMMAASHGKLPPLLEEDTRFKHLKKEVKVLKDKICDIMRRLDDTVQIAITLSSASAYP